MTRNVRYGASLRSDARQVSRSTGAAAAAWFWGVIGTFALIGAIGRVLAKVPAADWIGIGIGGTFAAAVLVFVLRDDTPSLPPTPPEPVPPLTDLRFSREFEGIW